MPSRTALGALIAGRKSASLRCRTTQWMQWPSCAPCSHKWPCLPLGLQELEISVDRYGHGSPKRACLPVPASAGTTKLPLFAHSQTPMRMGRPAASLSATAPDHRRKQNVRFGGGDPDASRLLKNRVSPAWAAPRPSRGEDFAHYVWMLAAYLSSATIRTMLSNSFSTSGWCLVKWRKMASLAINLAR